MGRGPLYKGDYGSWRDRYAAAGVGALESKGRAICPDCGGEGERKGLECRACGGWGVVRITTGGGE